MATEYHGPPLWAVAVLAGASLAYEVLLTRLFAIIQWHHFAHMVISLALLGYGASGSFLTLAGERARHAFPGWFVGNAVLAGVGAVAAFALAQRLPFNAQELAWDWRQALYLPVLYLLLALPFFCVANCIGLTLCRFPQRIPRIYAYDLAGAGGGALGVILLLDRLSPAQVLRVVGVLGVAAAALAVLELGRRRSRPGLGAILGLLLLAALPADWLAPHPSPYKGLSQTLEVQGAAVAAERSGPLGQVTVVANDRIPLRYAPGLSLASPSLPPPQFGLFVDGEPAGAITRFDGDLTSLDWLDWLTSALPYHLLARPRVLVLGAGGGLEVLQALYHGADRVDAVELNPQVVDLVRGPFAAFAGGLYDLPQVRVHLAEARRFAATGTAHYDLIQLAPLGGFGAAAAGLHALDESYLYTVEAFGDYLARLRPGGLLSVTRWLRLPPRDSLKLLATAAAALERAGVAESGRRLALIRGWKTTTLVVKNGPLEAAELAALRAFCRQRSFDLAWYPGMTEAEANRYNFLDEPLFYRGAVALLGAEKEAFLAAYKFDLRPATDDRPFFSHFFRWRSLPELLGLRAGGGLGQLEWGYLLLVATLIQAVVAGLALIVLPLKLSGAAPHQDGRWRVLVYFSSIGLGFLFLEIAFIQKFILFLGHPLYAVAVVLSGFLVFAALGSAAAGRWPRPGPMAAAAAVAVLALAYLPILPGLFRWAWDWPDPGRIALALALIAPLAGAMGMLFPLGLARLGRTAPALLPWAWAINGCASVVSAVLAGLLAMAVGFSGVVAAAAVLYLLAGMTAPQGGV